MVTCTAGPRRAKSICCRIRHDRRAAAFVCQSSFHRPFETALPPSPFHDLTHLGGRAFDRVGELADRMLDSNLRIGVTGLRRSGKTVFTTALVDNLLHADRLPFLDVVASGRFIAARMRPQPDHAVPRFDYESNLAKLTAPEPSWPHNTKSTSQVRGALRYTPGTVLKRGMRGVTRLNLDIVDYPGKWLLDLPLLDRSYAEWSRETLELARRPPRDALAAEWLEYLSNRDAAGP